MAGLVKETYTAVAMAANANKIFKAPSGLGGFLCTVAGTFDADDSNGAVVDVLPVTAGVYYAMPFSCVGDLTVTLSGGAAGTVGVAY
jgi:hypothetical protein